MYIVPSMCMQWQHASTAGLFMLYESKVTVRGCYEHVLARRVLLLQSEANVAIL